MRLLPLFILLLFIGCSKSPLFNTVDDNKVDLAQPLLAQNRIGQWNIGIQWIQGPRNIGEGDNIFKLRFWDPDKATVYGPYELPPQKICVFLWMLMPDGSEHGSSPVTLEIEDNDDGKLLVIRDAYFVMNGVWQIRVRLVKDNVSCKATKDFPFEKEVIFAADVD